MFDFYFGGVCAALFGTGFMLCACSRSALPGADPEAHTESTAARANTAVRVSSAPSSSGAGDVNHGVAVVELFTSEGCSSCPPADQALARLAARAHAQALPVFPLSFHVDYWNYLGWRDRFSSADFSERQHNYNWINPSGGTYTPQAVVNGHTETVGSNASRIDAFVEAALAVSAQAVVTLEARRKENAVEVSYRVTGETNAHVLNLALVEPYAESAVQNGENAGARLAHVNVVRDFVTRPLSPNASGTWSVVPNAELTGHTLGIVAYVEATAQRDIIGATSLTLD